MSRKRLLLVGLLLLSASAERAQAWSLLDEVTVLDPNLTASVVWEDPDVKSYCSNIPSDIDWLACEAITGVQGGTQDFDGLGARFWFGIDAAGNAYGVIQDSDVNGTYWDIHRRPAGTRLSEHIVRITERTEPAPLEVTKLTLSGRWQVDAVNGEILFNLRGECFTTTCTGQGDTLEHLALIRITGLPKLLDVTMSYEPGGALAFRIPVLPEGLPTGDFFDVYAGDLDTLPDLSMAFPLACDVGFGLGPGDLVVVTDTLPDPPAGEGRYYIAAVTSGIERRAGREQINGVLQGRDANVLPACP